MLGTILKGPHPTTVPFLLGVHARRHNADFLMNECNGWAATAVLFHILGHCCSLLYLEFSP